MRAESRKTLRAFFAPGVFLVISIAVMITTVSSIPEDVPLYIDCIVLAALYFMVFVGLILTDIWFILNGKEK